MKIFKFFLLFLLMIFTLSVSVSAEEDFYTEQYKNSGAEDIADSLPDSTRRYFQENGIDPSDYNWVNSLSAEGVFGHIWGFIKSGAKAPLRSGGAIIAIILISAALASAELKSSASTAAVYAAAAASAAVIAIPVSSVINTAVNALKGTSVFMLSFIPVFAVIVAASGAAVTSASMSALLLAASQGVSYVSGFVVLPLMGGYLTLAVGNSVSPLLKKSGLTDIIKKIMIWITAFISTVFMGILSIQTAVNSSADTLVSKTAKFIIGSSIPVAGGVLSEALGTVTASMGILKSSVGIYGIIACVITLLPIIIEILIWRGILIISCAISDMFSLPQISGLLKSVDSVMSLLVGIVLLVGAMFVISLAVVVSGVKTQ